MGKSCSFEPSLTIINSNYRAMGSCVREQYNPKYLPEYRVCSRSTQTAHQRPPFRLGGDTHQHTATHHNPGRKTGH